MSLQALLARARACRECAPAIQPRPVIRVGERAKIAVLGQAPGSRVHATGVPWDDPSGEHLREWLDVDEATFADPHRFAILPMGLCYPGKGKSGDAPPRPECAPLWHGPILDALDIELYLVIGMYAHRRYLPDREKTLTATVHRFADYGEYFPLPHPSWRSRGWRTRNPWFDAEVLPALRERVHALI